MSRNGLHPPSIASGVHSDAANVADALIRLFQRGEVTGIASAAAAGVIQVTGLTLRGRQRLEPGE